VQCGSCHKRFQAPPDLRNRQVHCPYCKAAVRVVPGTDVARAAVAAMSDVVAHEKQEQQKRPLTARHQVILARGGVRSKGLAILWVTVIGMALIGAAVAIVMLTRSGWSTADGGSPSVLKISGRSLFQKEEVGPSGAASPRAAAPSGAAASAGAPPAGQDAGAVAGPSRPTDAVTVKIERLIGGYRSGTITYAIGRVTNNTASTVRSVKVGVTISDKEDKELGEATAVILNLPGGATAPVVAEWQHDEGVRGSRWFPWFELNPVIRAEDLPVMQVEDPVALRDPNANATTGKITAQVTNLGMLPVQQVQVYAILIDAAGKVQGAARAVVDQNLPPKKPVEVSIPWEQCAGHLVYSTQVWVQPTF
jgi:hypothetical protein